MANINALLISIFLPLLLLGVQVRSELTFHFENNCQETLWRASSPSLGDLDPELGPKIFEIFNMDDPWSGQIWVRTKCTFNQSNYYTCETGDCRNGERLCAGPRPDFPVTLLDFNVNQGVVTYEVSLVHGQNVLVRIEPKGGTLVDGSGPCPMVDCNKDIGNVCPPSFIKYDNGGHYLGCNSACDKFQTTQYCCLPGSPDCQIDEYSQKFKDLCPFAQTYPGDPKPPKYKCKGAESYDITFCPSI